MKQYRIKPKMLLSAAMAVLTCAAPAAVSAADTTPYPTYTITSIYEEVPSPAAYSPVAVYYGDDMGLGKLDTPSDMDAAGDRLYIVDAGRNLLAAVDESFQVIDTVETFVWEGEETSLSGPQGVCVAPDGSVYVADTGNARIVKFTGDLEVAAVLGKPVIDVMSGDYEYKPLKVGVDKARRIYVVAQGINEGLIELTETGEFTTFVGAPKVTYDLLTYLWKRILSSEASQYLEKFVPTEFSNIHIDEDGFIYSTVSANDHEKLQTAIRSFDGYSVKAIQKFNASGVDILKRRGDVPIVGDVNFMTDTTGTVDGPAYRPSKFVDVAVDGAGNYFCLDAQRSRIFAYDDDGNMLYAFGSSGNQLGTYTTPVAVNLFGGRLLVLDAALRRITVLESTDYGRLLGEAGAAYINGHYEQALELYDDIFKYNANLSIAYIGKGKCQYYLGQYEEAVKNLKAADEYYYCSKAFTRYRQERMLEVMTPILIVLAVVAAGIAALLIVRRVRRGKAGKDA